jgi:hypothetical protein
MKLDYTVPPPKPRSAGLGAVPFAKWGHSLTSQFDAPTLTRMIFKRSLLLLMVGAVLLLQLADCMAAYSQDQQAMQCCGTWTCTPASQSHGCCRTMNSTLTPRMLVKARASLDVTAVVVVERAPALEMATSTLLIPPAFEPQRYSSPDLYTLHSSLLI